MIKEKVFKTEEEYDNYCASTEFNMNVIDVCLENINMAQGDEVNVCKIRLELPNKTQTFLITVEEEDLEVTLENGKNIMEMKGNWEVVEEINRALNFLRSINKSII